MQLTHAEWKEIAETAAQCERTGSGPHAGTKTWIGVLVLLCLASLAYAVFGVGELFCVLLLLLAAYACTLKPVLFGKHSAESFRQPDVPGSIFPRPVWTRSSGIF